MLEYKRTRADLEIGLVSTGVDVGPAIYLARTFGTDIDTVVKFFIFILIFVFDPLAVMLVIAYNQALLERKPKKKTQHDNWKDIYSQPTLIEDDERMDIIGQNGNDGLHYELEESDVEPREENDPGPKKILKGGVKIK